MALPVLQLKKTLKYQKIYDAEHRAEKEEIRKNIKIITNMTLTVNMKNKNNLYQKKQDKYNYKKVRMSQGACYLATYQTYLKVIETLGRKK